MLPGSHYRDPEFSWKFEVAPAGIGFMEGRGLGPQYENDLFTGAARTNLEGGQLFHFNLTGNRQKIGVDDPRLEDRVADNLCKFDITESESLLFGRNFGIGTDIQTGPNGNLFVVSLSNGAIYEIFRQARGRP
jgi:glucose/arabinose dehydrogenase